MRNIFGRVAANAAKVTDWIEVPANRKRLYVLLATFGPIVAAAGFVTPAEVSHWLDVASAVLMLGGGSMAAKHV